MESTGTYQAGDTADESATPEKVTPLRRGFFMPENDYVDRLAGVIDGRTGWVLTYLLRQTVGFHRTDFRCSQKQLAKTLRYARNTLAAALRELESLHVITSDADSLSKTQLRTFRLEPIESWTLPARNDETCSNFEQVETLSENEQAPTISRNEQDGTTTCAEIEHVEPATCSNFEHAINIGEINTSEVKDNETDANASGHGVDTPASDTPPSSSEKKSSRTRKERRPPTPEEEYRAALIAAVSEVRGYKHTNHGMEWKAAGEFWRNGGNGPVPIADVAEFTRIELRRPKWDSESLHLQMILQRYPVYLRGKPGYVEAISRARRAADGEYDRPRASQNGHKPTSPPAVDTTEDALTRKGIETRERLRRMREEEAAAAKGEPS